jgi:hypothetical protein
MLQNGFASDSVSIFIDGELHSTAYMVTTNPYINWAGGLQTSVSNGFHTVGIAVLTNQIRRDTTFQHSGSNFFVVVDYFRSANQISFSLTEQQPLNWQY